jgi:hypothetical protein
VGTSKRVRVVRSIVRRCCSVQSQIRAISDYVGPSTFALRDVKRFSRRRTAHASYFAAVPTQKSVLIEGVELVARRGRVQGHVRTPRFPALLPSPLPSTPAALHAENLALRHQLFVLQRVHQNRRLRLRSCDPLVWVWLCRVWPNWRSCGSSKLDRPEVIDFSGT